MGTQIFPSCSAHLYDRRVFSTIMSRCLQMVENTRRSYKWAEQLGKIWVSDWDSAHSPWADQFKLVVNCCHKNRRTRWIHRSSDPWSLEASECHGVWGLEQISISILI